MIINQFLLPNATKEWTESPSLFRDLKRFHSNALTCLKTSLKLTTASYPLHLSPIYKHLKVLLFFPQRSNTSAPLAPRKLSLWHLRVRCSVECTTSRQRMLLSSSSHTPRAVPVMVLNASAVLRQKWITQDPANTVAFLPQPPALITARITISPQTPIKSAVFSR